MKIDEQIKNLKELNLPIDQYVVVSSGTLAIRGIREANNIDVVVTEDLWKDLSQKYEVTFNAWGVEKLDLPHDIEILNPKRSIFGNSKVVPFKDIFVKAENFDGVKFMNLDHLKLIKKQIGRQMDLDDIKKIDEYLASHSST